MSESTHSPDVACLERQRLWIGAVTLIVFFGVFAWMLNQQQAVRLRSDIYLRWYATDQLLANGRNIYDQQNAIDVNLLVYGVPQIEMRPGFYYPAHLLILTVPLAWLPYRTAHFIWTFLGQVLYLVGVAVVIKHAGWPQRASRITLLVVLTILFVPNLQHTIWSQFNTIGFASLGLCYTALRREKYALAGALAVGMTIKPHPYVLVLVFLAGWALMQRERRPFLLGMAVAGAGSWLVANLLQPGWVLDFFASLNNYLPTTAVIDRVGDPYQLFSVGLIVVVLVICWRYRQVTVTSASFAGCLGLTLSIWVLIMPIVGMKHIIDLVIPLILLLSHYRQINKTIYHWMWRSFLASYVIGWIAFVWGLVGPNSYGLHITWAQAVNKAWLPILMTVWALPVLLGKEKSA